MQGLVHDRGGSLWCVVGDFNSVLSALERKGVRARSFGLDSMEFQNFVVDVGLVDLPLCGRRFTWYRSDGSAMSRLDCFLISDRWLESNPNVTGERLIGPLPNSA